MTSRYEPYRELLRLSTRPVFLITDFLGVVGLTASQFLSTPWAGVAAAVGSALLAIGFSLPIALFYQLRASAESLKILDACNRSGIRAIFKSRQDDNVELRAAIDSAAARSTEIKLLGIAFRSLFDPSGEYTQQVRQRLDDPRVHLRVLLLDPDSKAANHRAHIEKGNTTIEDIRFTINNGIPTTIQERLRHVFESSSDGTQQLMWPTPNEKGSPKGNQSQEEYETHCKSACNIEVRVYNLAPIAFLMIFQESVFVEQYHLGRPQTLRAGSCIGKHVPVVEYLSTADACSFLLKHYEEMWNLSKDITDEVVNLAVTEGLSILERAT